MEWDSSTQNTKLGCTLSKFGHPEDTSGEFLRNARTKQVHYTVCKAKGDHHFNNNRSQDPKT
jgi:hypothetical protein